LPYPYVALYFDVAVSTTSAPAPSPEGPNLEAAWWFLTAKRIDVVGELPHRWDLIELRRGAGQAALGALRLYNHLLKQDPPDEKPTHLILVTDQPDPDIIGLAELEGIELIILGPTPGE